MRPFAPFAIAAAIGCSSGSLAGPDGAAPPHDGYTLDRFTDADVTTPAGFCAEWMAIWSLFPGCFARDDKGSVGQPYSCARFAASVEAGRVSWDLARAESCLSGAYHGAGSECGYRFGECSGTSPQVELGGACSPNALAPECKGDAFCLAVTSGACTGTCVPRQSEGEPCAHHADCAGGLSCGDTGHCTSSFASGGCSFASGPACQPAGASCNPAAVQTVCVWGTVCDPMTTTCRAPGKPGDACGASGDPPCGWDPSARCDAASKTCVICAD
jgi:hypothetical protein